MVVSLVVSSYYVSVVGISLTLDYVALSMIGAWISFFTLTLYETISKKDVNLIISLPIAIVAACIVVVALGNPVFHKTWTGIGYVVAATAIGTTLVIIDSTYITPWAKGKLDKGHYIVGACSLYIDMVMIIAAEFIML